MIKSPRQEWWKWIWLWFILREGSVIEDHTRVRFKHNSSDYIEMGDGLKGRKHLHLWKWGRKGTSSPKSDLIDTRLSQLPKSGSGERCTTPEPGPVCPLLRIYLILSGHPNPPLLPTWFWLDTGIGWWVQIQSLKIDLIGHRPMSVWTLNLGRTPVRCTITSSAGRHMWLPCTAINLK